MVRIPITDIDIELMYFATFDQDYIVRYDVARNNFFAVSESGNLLIHKSALEEWHKYILPKTNFGLKLKRSEGYFEVVEEETYSSVQAYEAYRPKGEVLRQFEIFDKENVLFLKKDIRETFNGRVTIKNLRPMKYLDFDYVSEYEDGIELRNKNRDTLLFVRFRSSLVREGRYLPLKGYRQHCIKLLELSSSEEA